MIIAVVDEIANGYIITNLTDGTRHFVDKFDINVLVNTDVDHEVTLKILVNSFPGDSGKIPAIKAVRNYCAGYAYHKYSGLKEAKDFVENLRADFRPPTGWHPTE